MERKYTYSSWSNGKAERHVQTACGMLRLGRIDHGLGDELWCCKCEDTTQKYNVIVHSGHSDLPDFRWYGQRPQVKSVSIFGYQLEALVGKYIHTLEPRTEEGYYLGTTSTKPVIRHWKPKKPKRNILCNCLFL